MPGSIIMKAVVSSWLDTLEPRDAMQITPHFKVTWAIGPPDYNQLATDLLNAWKGYTQFGTTTQHRVTLYDAQGTPPVYPLATKEANTGLVAASAVNRDIALCLSYYSDFNRPRHRGRLYLSPALLGMAISGATASSGPRTKAAALVPLLSGLGGVDVDWVVYSRVDNASRKVTNWWVDDSWDSQRRRGKRAAMRDVGTTGG